jgi:energy-coupling factor transport system ATP-binding protein
MEIIQVKNLSFTYPGCTDKVIDNVSFSIDSGEFVVICGETGCGKTTLLKMLKRELTPFGQSEGEISYNGISLEKLEDRTASCEIGFVMQKPENQIVTDKVWHELSFGLENMGLSTQVIRRRVSEMSSYFGIGDWFHKDISELSGGQKQVLNLASVMVMQPKVLILDEPTAQLDPITASEFIATLQRLNRDFSITILLVEHRLEEVLPIADNVMLLEKGKLIYYDTPRKVAKQLKNNERMMNAMPCAVRIFNAFQTDVFCPLTVKECRSFIENNFYTNIRALEKVSKCDISRNRREIVLRIKGVWFRYHKDSPDILKGADLTVYQNEILCILGGNASGKTTLLGVVAGILKAYGGSVSLFGKNLKDYKNGTLYQHNLALLPQDVATLFLGDTVEEDLKELKIEEFNLPFDISALMNKHPYDLSGGEQQLCALAKVLGQRPRILLLDEPTKGIDAFAKQGVLRILRELKTMGMTIVIVTHDVEFAAECADRCALFFDGNITSIDEPDLFFAENSFYTTAANRITRQFYDNVVTVGEAVNLLRLNGEKKEAKMAR